MSGKLTKELTREEKMAQSLKDEYAVQEQHNQLYWLICDRIKNGYSTFMTDLKGITYNFFREEGLSLRDESQRNWCLIPLKAGGVIKLYNKHTEADIAEIHSLLKKLLKAHEWHQDPEKAKTLERKIYYPTSHQEFPDYEPPKLKTLGANGVNQAVDPILLIQGEDGRIKVLSGKRPTGEFALPGGMKEGNVRQTCFDEILEEVYGGSLFDGASANNSEAEKFKKNHRYEFALRVANAINDLKIDPELRSMIQEKFESSKPKFAFFEACTKPIYAILNDIKRLLDKRTDLKQAQVDHIMIRLKCELFAKILPDQHRAFKDFIDRKLEAQEEVTNQSDPRASMLAIMRTTPLEGLFTSDELATVAVNAGLAMKAGDDLGGPCLRDIEEFAGNGFSDHASFILQAVSRQLASGQLEMSPALSEQLEVFKGAIDLKRASREAGKNPVEALELAQQYIQDNKPQPAAGAAKRAKA